MKTTREKIKRLRVIKKMWEGLYKKELNTLNKASTLLSEHKDILTSIPKADRELYADDISKYENLS